MRREVHPCGPGGRSRGHRLPAPLAPEKLHLHTTCLARQKERAKLGKDVRECGVIFLHQLIFCFIEFIFSRNDDI